jgi:hypothetical protein
MQIAKQGRTAAALLANVLAAFFGTAILSSALGRSLWHPHSIQALLRISYGYDVIVAAMLGFIVFRRFKTQTAKWIWIIAALWLLTRAFLLLSSGDSLWAQFSGVACSQGMGAMGCVNWFLFTIPFVRIASYSAGAWLCSRFGSHASSGIGNALLGNFHKHEWPSAEKRPDDWTRLS